MIVVKILLKFKSFFKIIDSYSFASSGNMLTLSAGSLEYLPNRQYEILVSTIYLNIEYTQKVRITIENIDQLPISILKYYETI